MNQGKILCLMIYFVIMNMGAFALYDKDKKMAIKNKRRIREGTLLGVAFFGGSVGAWLAMKVFHHKTKKYYFALGIPLMFLIQMAIGYYFLIKGF